MNRGLWIARKNYLLILIKKVSDGHGGDDKEFFDTHCEQVILSSDGDKIEDAIAAYEDCLSQLKYYKD